MAAPTAEEIPILEKFRKEIADLELKDEQKTDIALLSWLRARNLDIPNAVDMLRQSLQWRKENKIDTVLDWKPPASYKTEYDFEIVGSDREGRPICIIPFGVWDVRKIVNSGERETWLRYMDLLFALQFEKMKETSKLLNQEVTQFVFIVDFAEFSMRQLTSFSNVDTILEVVRRFEANYPERMYALYFVNASRLFTMLFAFIKPILTARTLSKVQIYSKPSKWQPVLLNDLPADQLPVEFGGTKGGRRVSIGSFPHADSDLVEGQDFITVKVGSGQKLDLEFGVQQPNTKIMWIFKTDGYDIGFNISRDRKEEVVAYKRYDSHLTQISGEIICDKLGEYFLTFDNSYSKMREKTVHYFIDFLEPIIAEDEE